MSDPDELPGLAHFCEHMLFLGTEKYPEENEYNKVSRCTGVTAWRWVTQCTGVTACRRVTQCTGVVKMNLSSADVQKFTEFSGVVRGQVSVTKT